MTSTPPTEHPNSETLSPKTEATADRSASWIQTIALFCVYAVVMLVSMRPFLSKDIWWHMAAGRWIVQNGQIPWTDPFSSFGQGKTWIAYSWLFELVVYGVHSIGGLTGILLFRTAMSLSITIALQRLITTFEKRWWLVISYLTGLVAVMSQLTPERPWLMTILFSVLTLQVIVDLRRGQPNHLTWWLPLIYVLWANLHIQVVYGYFFLGLACISPLIDYLIGQEDREYAARPGTPEWQRLVKVTVLCVLAFFVTPYHVYLSVIVYQYATQKVALNAIGEMQALSFRVACHWVTLAVGLVSTFCLGRRRFSAFELLALVGACYFSFRSTRDVWMLSLVGAIIIPPTFRSRETAPAKFGVRSIHKVVLLAALVLFAGLLVYKGGASEQELQKAVARDFPKAAIEWIEENNPSGLLYNSYNWGGYIIWDLDVPDLLVAIDGRANLHGGKRIAAFLRTVRLQPDWEDNPDFQSARLLLLESNAPILQHLKTDRRYEFVYEDDIAVVVRKVDP
ncbi:MAG: hypothetical protein ACFCD0_07290 [Gemmataceae bacterium]